MSFTLDSTAPALSSATVNGSIVTLTYSEVLDTLSTPLLTNFTLSGGHIVTGVSLTGSTILLTISPTLTSSESLTFDYTPGLTPIQDSLGNHALALATQSITNSTPVVSTGGGIAISFLSNPMSTSSSTSQSTTNTSQGLESNTYIGKNFLYSSEDQSILTKLQSQYGADKVTPDTYKNTCETKQGKPYYRTCALGSSLNTFNLFAKNVICEGFTTQSQDALVSSTLAPRKEVVGIAVKMKKDHGESVPLVTETEYLNLFSDVGFSPDEASWIHPVIETALKYGIITQTHSTFEPERATTRAEAYGMIMKSVCMDATADSSNWQENLYDRASQEGLTTRSWNTFSPDATITKQELFTLASRASDWAERTGGCDPKPEYCFLKE